MRIDTSDADRLAEDFGRIPGKLIPEVVTLLAKTGLETKNETRKRVSSHKRWRRIAGSVNYHMKGLAVEVGYDDIGQGELAGIYEFGSARRAPHPTLGPVSIVQAKLFQMGAVQILKKVTS